MRAFGLIGIVLALGATYVLYNAGMPASELGATASPQEQIDVTSIRTALLEIGQAQRQYVIAHGAYGTLDELRADGAPTLGAERRGYVFRSEPRGSQGFTATATPTDPAKPGWPTLAIDETMQIATR